MTEYNVTIFDGRTEWRNQDGEIHRLDGPAFGTDDGSKFWYVNDKLHRTDGPAVERADGYKSWWIEGCRYSEEEFNEKIKQETEKKNLYDAVDVSKYSGIRYKVRVYEGRTEWMNQNNELHKLNGPAIEYSDGHKCWYVDGKYHRLDGPAIVHANGSEFWYVNGECHRLGGPAIKWANGTKFWLANGKPHRTNGPAVEWEDGTKSWWIDGTEYSEKRFNKKTGKSKPTIFDVVISKFKNIFN